VYSQSLPGKQSLAMFCILSHSLFEGGRMQQHFLWLSKDCETRCMLNAKIWRGVGLQAPSARKPSPANSVQFQQLQREEVS